MISRIIAPERTAIRSPMVRPESGMVRRACAPLIPGGRRRPGSPPPGFVAPPRRARLVRPSHAPQGAVEIEVTGFRLRHHAVEIPAGGGPEMPGILGRDDGE